MALSAGFSVPLSCQIFVGSPESFLAEHETDLQRKRTRKPTRKRKRIERRLKTVIAAPLLRKTVLIDYERD